jgi:hypothetical protein
MLRLACSTLAVLALSLPVQAQTTYNIFTNVGTTFTDISGSGSVQLTPSDDVVSGPVALPFTFNLYGVNYSSVVLSTNGNLQFGGTANTAFNNLDLVTNNSPNTAGFVAGFWDDLDATGATFTAPAGRVLTQTLGSPGSQIFVAQWHQWGHNDDGNGDPARSITFQIKLFEGSNNIAFVYSDAVFPFSPADNGASATVGITSGPFNDPLNPPAQFSFNSASLNGVNDILFSTVPEPSTMIMGGAGVAMSLAGLYRWKRRQRRIKKKAQAK